MARDQGTYEVGQKLMVAYQTLGLGSFTYSLGSYIGAHTENETSALLAYDGKTIRLTNGKYYRITVYQSSAKMRKEGDVTSASMPNLYSLMNQAVAATGLFDSSHKTGDDDSYDYDCTYATYRVAAAEIPTLSTKTKLSATRQHTKDALYDVFCMPYGDITVSDATIGEFGISKEIELQAVIALSTKLSSGLYDIQILPYCPLTSQISEGRIATQGKEGVAYD